MTNTIKHLNINHLPLTELLAQLSAWAKNKTDIIALYLYGSQAHGQANALSDVDIAVLVESSYSRSKWWDLERAYGTYWPEYVDIRILNLAPLPFRYQVTTQGERFWTADAEIVADVESLIWRQYWDWKPHQEENWQQYVTQVMEKRNEVERAKYEATLAKVRAVHQRVREV